MRSKLMVFISMLVVLGIVVVPAGTALAQDGSGIDEQNCSLYSQTFSSDRNSAQIIPAECTSLYQRQINSVKFGDVNPKFTQPFSIDTIQDPEFESSFGSSLYWSQSSTNFGSPLCTLVACGDGNGTARPLGGGAVWAWFGGVPSPNNEVASLSQTVTIPTTAYSLRFYFGIGVASSDSNSSDIFMASIDGTPVFTANATQISSYPLYSLVGVNVRPFADGGMHTITFSSSTWHLVNFNLDGVFLSEIAFVDVYLMHPYFLDIQILYANGYTGGCSTSPFLYCPDTIMNRAQAAVFMMRGNFGGGYLPPSPPLHLFADSWVNAPWGETWAEAMFTNGLTAGCSASPLRFCPDDQLTNVQAAVFGLRLKYGVAYTPPAASGAVFADMTDPSFWGDSWAEQAYADGLLPACGTSGGEPKFCPNALVTRGFGASIIVKAKNLTMP